MSALPATSISEHIATLTAPRRDHLRTHARLDIVPITLCTVICGADGRVDIVTFGRVKAAWLRTFSALPGGIASHDAFGRVFARLDPDELRRCFLSRTQVVVGPPGEQVVANGGAASPSTTLRISPSSDTSPSISSVRNPHAVPAWLPHGSAPRSTTPIFALSSLV